MVTFIVNGWFTQLEIFEQFNQCFSKTWNVNCQFEYVPYEDVIFVTLSLYKA